MGWKVIFAPTALRRLEEIVILIAKDKPNAALKFGMRLLDRAELLSDFPDLGRPYRKRRDLRRLLCKPYIIYYRLNREQQLIEVMDFWGRILTLLPDRSAAFTPLQRPLRTRPPNSFASTWHESKRRERRAPAIPGLRQAGSSDKMRSISGTRLNATPICEMNR